MRYIVEIEYETRPHRHSYIFQMKSTSKLKKLFDLFVGVLHGDVNVDDIRFFYEDGAPFPIRMHFRDSLDAHVTEIHDNNKVTFLAKLLRRGGRTVSRPTFKKRKKSKQSRKRTRH